MYTLKTKYTNDATFTITHDGLLVKIVHEYDDGERKVMFLTPAMVAACPAVLNDDEPGIRDAMKYSCSEWSVEATESKG